MTFEAAALNVFSKKTQQQQEWIKDQVEVLWVFFITSQWRQNLINLRLLKCPLSNAFCLSRSLTCTIFLYWSYTPQMYVPQAWAPCFPSLKGHNLYLFILPAPMPLLFDNLQIINDHYTGRDQFSYEDSNCYIKKDSDLRPIQTQNFS